MLQLRLPSDLPSLTNRASFTSSILRCTCHDLVSSPMVAHFSRILKGRPFSTRASQIALPLFTDSRILSCASISAKSSIAKLLFSPLLMQIVFNRTHGDLCIPTRLWLEFINTFTDSKTIGDLST